MTIASNLTFVDLGNVKLDYSLSCLVDPDEVRIYFSKKSVKHAHNIGNGKVWIWLGFKEKLEERVILNIHTGSAYNEREV